MILKYQFHNQIDFNFERKKKQSIEFLYIHKNFHAYFFLQQMGVSANEFWIKKRKKKRIKIHIHTITDQYVIVCTSYTPCTFSLFIQWKYQTDIYNPNPYAMN